MSANVTTTALGQYQSVSGAGYRVFPEPVQYHDDGKTAVTVKLLSVAADNLTTFTLSGESAIDVPVSMTAGNIPASITDIVAAVNPGFFANAFNNMILVSRDEFNRGFITSRRSLPFEDVEFSGATDAFVSCSRLVILETGTHGEGTYNMLDAAFPATVAFPGPNPDSGEASVSYPYKVGTLSWVWIPELKSLHQITNSLNQNGQGGGLYTQHQRDVYGITLSPVPATNAGELYTILPVPMMNENTTVKNVGVSAAIVDGQTLAAGREMTFRRRKSPIRYNPQGTDLEWTFDGNF